MYIVHLRLIIKRTVDFLLVIIELFSLIITTDASKYRWEIAVFEGVGQCCPKFQVEGDPPTILPGTKLGTSTIHMV